MKTISLINWLAIGLYALGIAGTLLTAKWQSERMAEGMLLMLYIPLSILAILNYLPYKTTKIIALIVNIYPIVMGVFSLGISKVIGYYEDSSYQQEFDARADGSYYFEDPVRRNLAAYISAGDIPNLKKALEEPVPNLNATGDKHVTLFDFAAMQAGKVPKETSMATLKLLLDKGAKIETNDMLRTPPQLLVLSSDPALLALLLENGANANAFEKDPDFHILFKALYLDNKDPFKAKKVALLLDHGADANTLYRSYDDDVIVSSILHAAVDAEQWEICNLLLDHGAEIGSNNEESSIIRESVTYRSKQFETLDEIPPLEFTTLKKRLSTSQ
jgi:hypothetical protein